MARPLHDVASASDAMGNALARWIADQLDALKPMLEQLLQSGTTKPGTTAR